jgi:hypothetical protein
MELSQEALCERITPAMSHSLYRGYESGKSSPTIRQLVKLTRGLGLDGQTDAERLARFFLGPDPQPSATATRTHARVAFLIYKLLRAGRAREDIASAIGLGLSELQFVEQGLRGITLDQLRTLCEMGEFPADEVLELPVRLPVEVQEKLAGLLQTIQAMSKHLDSLEEDISRLRIDTP